MFLYILFEILILFIIFISLNLYNKIRITIIVMIFIWVVYMINYKVLAYQEKKSRFFSRVSQSFKFRKNRRGSYALKPSSPVKPTRSRSRWFSIRKKVQKKLSQPLHIFLMQHRPCLIKTFIYKHIQYLMVSI